MGQFERTLIIADGGSYVHYVEGWLPSKSDSFALPRWWRSSSKPGARVRYTTIQNWSNNVYNLVTKQAQAEASAMEWIDATSAQGHHEVPGGG